MKMRKCCAQSEKCCALEKPNKRLTIDFLYLDTTICIRCQDTEKALEEALSSVAVVLNAAGYEITVSKVNISTRALAVQYQFISSPTIRINGNDIAVDLRETICEDCEDLCGDAVDCRVWVYNGVEYAAPPKEFIVDAILREVYNPRHEAPKQPYELPANLETYFSAKNRKDKAEQIM